MEVSCPNCYATYPINPERIPEKGTRPTCKRCGAVFTIVRASGDPIKDRAQRMKGYVLVRESTRKEEFLDESGDHPQNSPQRTLSVKAILEDRRFRLGACIAGVVLLLGFGAIFLWKQQVQSRFEKTLKSTLTQASNQRFTLDFQSTDFSLTGLSRHRGTIRGLTITDRESKGSIKLPDRIHFELEPGKRRFITKPFTVHMDNRGSKSVMKGCVLEAEERPGPHLKFKADEIFSIVNGIEVFTIRGIAFSFSTQGAEWMENPRLVLGEAEFGFQAADIDVWGEPVVKNADILVSVKNGLFVKEYPAGEGTPVNYTDLFRTKWGESKAVAALERCSFQVLGSRVTTSGRLDFKSPVERSEGTFRVTIQDFSHVMKYIHRVSERVFDRIVVGLVALDEKKAAAYDQNADSLEMTLSYTQSKLRINEHDLQDFI